MQLDHVLKKLNFDLLTSSPWWRGEEGGLFGICGQNICYHVSAFMVFFNKICNTCLKKLNFDLLTPSPGPEGGGVSWALQAKYLVPCCCICDSL